MRLIFSEKSSSKHRNTIFPNFLLQLLLTSRLPFKYGVAKKLVRHLLAKKIEMVAAESMGLTFVDEDGLPVAFLRIAHVDSDNEVPSDVNSRDEEEQNYSNMRWTSVIQPPEGVNFREEVGMRVEMDNDNNCLDYFQPQLILRETKRFEHQKRQLEDNSLGGLHDFTLPELKAWLGLTLEMGLVKKSNLKAHWSTDSVTKTPLFSNTMSRDYYLHIQRYLHFVNNCNAPDQTDPNRDKLRKMRSFLDALVPRYAGKEGPAASKDLAQRVVLMLTEPYFNKAYKLFVVNWYTSVPLFLELEKKKELESVEQ